MDDICVDNPNAGVSIAINKTFDNHADAVKAMTDAIEKYGIKNVRSLSVYSQKNYPQTYYEAKTIEEADTKAVFYFTGRFSMDESA